jgi:hypothetical protein
MGRAKVAGLITDKVEQVLHKPSRTPTDRVELSEEEWLALYNPDHRRDQ